MRFAFASNIGYVYLLCIVIIDILMMYFLTASDGFANKKATLISLACYAVTFIFAGLALKHLPTGLVYALWGGVGTVGCVLVAYLFMGQKLDLAAYIGIGFIIIGVVIIELFSNSAG